MEDIKLYTKNMRDQAQYLEHCNDNIGRIVNSSNVFVKVADDLGVVMENFFQKVVRLVCAIDWKIVIAILNIVMAILAILSGAAVSICCRHCKQKQQSLSASL